MLQIVISRQITMNKTVLWHCFSNSCTINNLFKLFCMLVSHLVMFSCRPIEKFLTILSCSWSLTVLEWTCFSWIILLSILLSLIHKNVNFDRVELATALVLFYRTIFYFLLIYEDSTNGKHLDSDSMMNIFAKVKSNLFSLFKVIKDVSYCTSICPN